MANYIVTDSQLTAIADAIRAKTLKSQPIQFPDGFTSELGDIVSTDQLQAGYSAGVHAPTDLNTHEISANGEYTGRIVVPPVSGMFLPLTDLSYAEKQRIFNKFNSIDATFSLTANGGTEGLVTSYSYEYTDKIYFDYTIKNNNSTAKTITMIEINITLYCTTGLAVIPS